MAIYIKGIRTAFTSVLLAKQWLAEQDKKEKAVTKTPAKTTAKSTADK